MNNFQDFPNRKYEYDTNIVVVVSRNTVEGAGNTQIIKVQKIVSKRNTA